MSRWLSNLIQVVITIVWAATTCAPLVPGVTYEPNPWIHFIFLMTTGANLVARKGPTGEGEDPRAALVSSFLEFMKTRSGGGGP